MGNVISSPTKEGNAIFIKGTVIARTPRSGDEANPLVHPRLISM